MPGTGRVVTCPISYEHPDEYNHPACMPAVSLPICYMPLAGGLRGTGKCVGHSPAQDPVESSFTFSFFYHPSDTATICSSAKPQLDAPNNTAQMNRFKTSLHSLLRRKYLKRPSDVATSLGQQSHPATVSNPPGPASASKFPGGVKVLHDCPDAMVDLCFVHGLGGHRETTWTADGQSVPWPKAILPSTLGRAHILTYGYDAHVVRTSVASGNRLMDHSNDLLNDLTRYREKHNTVARPLIFIAHSLGGIVCKAAILRSRNHEQPHLCGIFESLKGVIFMGTPHQGARLANWAVIPASAVGLVKSTNTSLLDVLATSNEYLEYIQAHFLGLVKRREREKRGIEITCFYEELPLEGVGYVVPRESATLQGHAVFGIHANHRDMVKFSSVEENDFDKLLGELDRWVSNIGEQIQDDTKEFA